MSQESVFEVFWKQNERSAGLMESGFCGQTATNQCPSIQSTVHRVRNKKKITGLHSTETISKMGLQSVWYIGGRIGHVIELWLNNYSCYSRGYETIQTMLSINHVPAQPISTYLAVITTFKQGLSERQQITMEMTSNGHGWCEIVSRTGYFMLRVTYS